MIALSSTAVEEISHQCSSDPGLAIAYFYFGFNNGNKDTPSDAVLRSLIKQLSVQCVSTPHALDSLFSKNEEHGVYWTPGHEELMTTLNSIIGSFQAVYIVLDAVDECPERSRLLTVLKQIHKWGYDTLHLLMTSRKERDIEEMLHGLVSHEVLMDKSCVDDDIRLYVSKTLDEDIKLSMCSVEEKEMVRASLMRGAQGM
jgi:hypothetical protein